MSESKDPTNWQMSPSDVVEHHAGRIENGFSVFDFWNFDSYLAWVILGGLKKFRADGCGYPGELTEDSWNAILDEMIVGFEDYVSDKILKDTEQFAKSMELFVKWFSALWD